MVTFEDLLPFSILEISKTHHFLFIIDQVSEVSHGDCYNVTNSSVDAVLFKNSFNFTLNS
jgi:hypothetical protein